MRTVLTIGTFDTPHLGHAYLFKECEKYGDHIIVGVNSDEFVEQYKGVKPTYNLDERTDLIRALGYFPITNHSAGRELIEQLMDVQLYTISVLAIGSDWARKDYYAQIDVDQDFMDKRRIAMLYIPRVGTLSSTELKSRVQ